MKLNHFLKNRVLWKVYVIWFFRRIVPLILLQIALLALVAQIFAKNVFVSKVLKNITLASETGYWTVVRYLFDSFLNSHPLTQVMILMGMGFFALILRDLIRSLLTYKTMWSRKEE